MTTITTERLILRPWTKDDFEPFYQINSDPRVMEYFPSVLNREESDMLAEKIISAFMQQGWGLWAVSIPTIASFIGFIGLAVPTFDAHFTPAVEVGWRLSRDFWGKGYATEGAKASIQYGFEMLKLNEIVSFTAKNNARSVAVMKKIGMHSNASDNFDHPNLPSQHPLKRHVLYRLKAEEWKENK